MKIFELLYDVEPIEEAARNILGRTKSGIKRKFRCTSGPRKGRIVSDPATCVKPIDVAKRVRARATRAKTQALHHSNVVEHLDQVQYQKSLRKPI